MENFIIVLFKNKIKKKIIKGYQTEQNAIKKFNHLIRENQVVYDVKFENSEPVKYEIAVLSKIHKTQETLFKPDEFGRNQKVFLENESDYVIHKISDYKIEEKIQDWQTNEKISFNEFIKKYCTDKNLKTISTLNNKIIVQNDDNFFIFSTKNLEDCERFLSVTESYFFGTSRKDAIFVRDISTIQRKWMYDILEKKGFDRNKLYRQTTTFSKRS